MPHRADNGRWQRGAESVLFLQRMGEREKTTGDFWLGVVVVRGGFMVLMTLKLNQRWRWGLLKKAAPFEESSVDTGPGKMLAWGKKDGLSILQRERKGKRTGGAASGQGVSGIGAGPGKEQGPRALLRFCSCCVVPRFRGLD